ncbi:MAG: SDR family oxidoreductase [Synechococcus sp.]|nr:SDR family oxidoreductase [Synechococcus sp.]
MQRLAVVGASGKTGWRVVDEALKRGMAVRAIVRPASILPEPLAQAERDNRLDVQRLELSTSEALIHAFKGCTSLVIATGARPSVNLAGPLQVDAMGVQAQIEACKTVGLNRVVLVSSLCAGRWLHPLNLFGLILLWKRLGEHWLERSGLKWTVIRPGGLSEDEARASTDGILFTSADQQQSDSIPRRLVAQVCLDALDMPEALNRTIEITSSSEQPKRSLHEWLRTQSA